MNRDRGVPTAHEDQENPRHKIRAVPRADEPASSESVVRPIRSQPTRTMPAGMVYFGRFSFDLHRLELRSGDEVVDLQRRHAEALALLLTRPGEIVSKQELIDALWGDAFVEYDKSLRPLINRLRLALSDSARHPTYLETVRGQGYRFLGAVSHEKPEAPTFDAELPPRLFLSAGVVLLTLALAIGLLMVFLLRGSGPSTELVGSVGYRLAVLPIEPGGELSEDDLQLIDGLALDLAGELTRQGGNTLQVVLPQFSRSVPQDPAELGGVLNADLLLYGTVEKAADRYGSVLSVVDTRSGDVLWSERQAASTIEGLGHSWKSLPNLLAHLRIEAGAPPVRSPSELRLRALYHLDRGNLEAVDRLALEALEQSPGDAEYLGLLSMSKTRQWAWTLVRDRAEEARAHALAALEADPSEFRSLQSMARLSFFIDRDPAAGQHYLQRARVANPRDPSLLMVLMNLHLARGETLEAVEVAREAALSSPLSGILQTEVSWVLYGAGEFEEAVERSAESLRLAPNYPLGYLVRILALEELGRHAEAATTVAQLLERSDRPPADRERVQLDVEAGEYKSFWLFWLDGLHKRGRVLYPEKFAIAFAALGDESMAVQWLEEAWERQTPWLAPVTTYPVLESLRSSEGFRTLRAKVSAMVSSDDTNPNRQRPLTTPERGRVDVSKPDTRSLLTEQSASMQPHGGSVTTRSDVVD